MASTQRACEGLGRHPDQQTILFSSAISGPLTIGLRHPAILVPHGLFENLGADDLEALFAHELAHIVRHDFARNLLYRALSAPLAFHPLSFQTLDQIAEAREMLCDDLAAARGLGERRYARSLLRLATLLAERPAGPVHAIGLLDANSFERRVMRLTRRTTVVPRRRALQFAAVAALSSVACASAMAFHLDVATPRAPRQQEASGAPARVAGAVMAGEKISGLNPIYPPEAKADKVGGTVKLRAIIGPEGTITELVVIQSVRPDIDASALDAVKTWRYKPYLLNGQPTAVDTFITVTYNLGDDSR